jgi:hypothetical protein
VNVFPLQKQDDNNNISLKFQESTKKLTCILKKKSGILHKFNQIHIFINEKNLFWGFSPLVPNTGHTAALSLT